MAMRRVEISQKRVGRHYWAINQGIEVEGRYITTNHSCDHFAIIHLRLEIDFDAAIIFEIAAHEHEIPTQFRSMFDAIVEASAEGIRDAIPKVTPDSLQIRALRITLVGIETNPVDTKVDDFRIAAHDAILKAVGVVGLSLGPELTD